MLGGVRYYLHLATEKGAKPLLYFIEIPVSYSLVAHKAQINITRRRLVPASERAEKVRLSNAVVLKSRANS